MNYNSFNSLNMFVACVARGTLELLLLVFRGEAEC